MPKKDALIIDVNLENYLVYLDLKVGAEVTIAGKHAEDATLAVRELAFVFISEQKFKDFLKDLTVLVKKHKGAMHK